MFVSLCLRVLNRHFVRLELAVKALVCITIVFTEHQQLPSICTHPNLQTRTQYLICINRTFLISAFNAVFPVGCQDAELNCIY